MSLLPPSSHRTAFPLLCFLTAITSCQDDHAITSQEREDPALLLSVIMPPNYPDVSAKYWTMIHDADGNVLDAASIKSGDTINFVSENDTLPENLQFTFLSVDTSNTKSDSYWIESFMELSPGAVLTLSPGPGNAALPSYGSFRIIITDLPRSTWNMVSTQYGRIPFTTAWIADETTANYTVHITCQLERPNTRHLISLEDDIGNVRYQFIDDIENGEEITIRADELKTPDNFIEAYYPANALGSSLNVFAYPEGQDIDYGGGYRLAGTNQLASSNTRRIPYLDGFTRYHTRFAVRYEDYSELMYLKDGSPVSESIIFPETMKVPTLTDKTFENFSVAAASEYSMRQNIFYYQNEAGLKKADVTWTIWSPRGDKRIRGIPQIVTDRYPVLDITKLKLYHSYFRIDAECYQELIKQRFHGATKPDPDEYFSSHIIER